VFIEAKDDGGGSDNWTTGGISRAKLQSNHHRQQTKNPNLNCIYEIVMKTWLLLKRYDAELSNETYNKMEQKFARSLREIRCNRNLTWINDCFHWGWCEEKLTGRRCKFQFLATTKHNGQRVQLDWITKVSWVVGWLVWNGRQDQHTIKQWNNTINW